ncbi:MAG: type II secretion system F family protein [Candidatus Omnitrophica bacterium]|nr:type II secretion system F family protein [Candidatus Omnitrophota bacterium]
MNAYQYIAKDRNGRAVTGIIESGSEPEAVQLLHNKSLVVISIKESKKIVTAKGQGGRVRLEDLVVFSRQLATLVDAGIPLVQSLGILGEQVENKTLKRAVILIRQDIEGGMSFCDALSKHPKIFSEFYVNMCRSGEASGMLDEILDRLATYLEKTASLNRKVASSLVYPAVVVSMAIIITGILLLKVVPTFKSIFDVLGGELPLPTRILIGVSDILRQAFVFIVVFVGFAVFSFKKYIDTPKGRYNFDSMKLKIFILGDLLRKVAVAKFSRTFSTLIKSGVTALAALEIVAKTSGNKVIEEAVLSSRTAVREGEAISQPLAKSGVFPPMVCRMIGVGETTGQLEKMLSKIADFYDDEVDASVAGLTSMIEPVVIAFLGIVIGSIVISLFLPILKITQLISH